MALKALTGDAQLTKAQSDLAAADVNAKRMGAQVQAASAMQAAGTAGGLTPAAIAAQQTTASGLSAQIQAANTTISAHRAQIASLTALTPPTPQATPVSSGGGFTQPSTITISGSFVDPRGTIIKDGAAPTLPATTAATAVMAAAMPNPTGGGAPVRRRPSFSAM